MTNGVIQKTDNNFLPVSCMCWTYGREQLLEEAIYSFLQQDYADVKELIVLNDLRKPTLIFNHHEVIINVSERITPLGAKRKECARYASHDTLLPWDDDISLSSRIRIQ